MPKFNDLSRSLAALDQNSTLVAAIEMGSESWLVGGMAPGLKRDPRKKLSPDKHGLLKLLHRWCAEAAKERRTIKRICVAYEAGQGWAAGHRRRRREAALTVASTARGYSRRAGPSGSTNCRSDQRHRVHHPQSFL